MNDAPASARWLTGRLLLSMPGIGDPRFERSVIAMCVHDEHGALGIRINAPLDRLSVRQLMEQLEIEPGITPAEVPVLVGGPVEPGRGFVLHSPGYEGQSTINVAGPGGMAWALTSTLDVLKDIATGHGPRQWLSTLGYVGWAAGQLDEELTRHGWHVADGDTGLLFDAPFENRWPLAFGQAGINVDKLSAVAGRA